MEKKKHTFGKFLAFTTVAVAIGGTCYIFRDKIKQCGLYEKAADKLSSLKNNIAGRLHKDDDFFFDDDDFKEDNNDVFAGKEQNREYTSITINAKDSEETPSAFPDFSRETEQTSEETEISSKAASDEKTAPADESVPVQNAANTNETASDENLDPAKEAISTEAEPQTSEPVFGTTPEDTTGDTATGRSETFDFSPTDEAAETKESARENEEITAITESSSETSDSSPADEAAETKEPAPKDEEITEITESSSNASASSPANEASETKDTAPKNIEITEITEHGTEAASQENIWESPEEDFEEAIPTISFGNSYKPVSIVTDEVSKENTVAAEATGYENEGLSDVSEDPDVLEEQDKLDF